MARRKTRKNTGGSRKRFRMLNVRRLDHFKYDLNEALKRSDMDEVQQDQFTANLITKASRNDIEDAVAYTKSMVNEGLIDEKTGDRIKKLLYRYSRYR